MKRLIALAVALVAIGLLLSACAVPQPAPQTASQTITICKKTIPPGGGPFPFTATSGGQGSPLPSFALSDPLCNPPINFANQDHFNKFTENVPAGWMLTGITCNNTTSFVRFLGATPHPSFQAGDNTVTIDLNEANVTCTFVNEPLPPCCAAFSLDLSTGQGNGPTDPLWSVNNGNAFITPPVASWIAIPGAQWIQPVAAPAPAPNVPASPPLYKYTVQFNVPPCSAGHVELSGTFAADNGATAFLDGPPAIPGATCAGTCFQSPLAPVPLNVGNIIPGPHVLAIEVNNLGGFSGLIVNAQVKRVCP